MKNKLFILYLFIIIFITPYINAAHYVVGIVNNARDGTNANGYTIVLWNSVNGINDNLTDVIGPTGNSHASNIYMIDCEMLNTSCNIDDKISVKVFNNGDNYLTSIVNVTITGAGFDIAQNLTLNTPFTITSTLVDDDISNPPNEIDLTTSNRSVNCEAIVNDLDNDSMILATGQFFDLSKSYYGDSDDKNYHYTNSSCYINDSKGYSGDTWVFCNFQVSYNANSSSWNCTITIEDNNSRYKNGSYNTYINPFLAIDVDPIIDYGSVGPNVVSQEHYLNVSNYGNIKINLSVSGYGMYEGDGNAMNCSSGKNISVYFEKFNLTSSNPGNLILTEFENYYVNLTEDFPVIIFNQDYRKNENYNEAVNKTYWRIYVPVGLRSGGCSGNVVFGARSAP